jgi:hypothetical protein
MHQTVREFFLLSHDTVSNTCFRAVQNETARGVLRTACTRYLSLHYKEAKNFESAHASWSSDDFRKFVEYLDCRPFLRYTLEYLSQERGVDHLLSELCTGFQKSPSAAFCLLKGVVNSSTHAGNVQQLKLHTRRRVEVQVNAARRGGIWILARTCQLVMEALTRRTEAPMKQPRGPCQQQLNHLLGVAAEEGRVVAVGNLLAAGADCGSLNKCGWTALHVAANNGQEAMVWLLLDHGAYIEASTSGTGMRPLHLAASKGHEVVVRLLLDRGADIRATNNDGWMPLHIAAHKGHDATVRLLLPRHAATALGRFERTRGRGWASAGPRSRHSGHE